MNTFTIFHPVSEKKIKIGDIIKFKKIMVEIVLVEGPYFECVNHSKTWRLKVKKT